MDIDSLQVKISSDSSSATNAVDRLITKLQTLNKTMESFGSSSSLKGIQNFSDSFAKVSDAINNIDTTRVKELSSSVRSLSNSFKSLETTVNSIKFDNVDNQTKQQTNNIDTIVDNINKLNGIRLPDISALDNVTASIRRLGGVKIDSAVRNIPQLTQSINAFASAINSMPQVNYDTTGLTNFANGIGVLGSKKITQATANLPSLGRDLTNFVSSINGLQTVSFDNSRLADLTKTIGVLGGKSVTNAISNLPNLTKALSDFIRTLSTMPNVSQNIIDTVNSLANLASQGQKVGSAMNGLSSVGKRSTKAFSGLSGVFNKTAKSGKGLAYMFGKMYASYFLLFRGLNKFGKAIKLSADLTEVQNVVNKSFGNMTQMVEDFSKTSIENFGMSILSAKQVSSQFQAMGNAMGITNAQVKASNSTWKDTSGMYNNVSESLADMSLNLTKLAADMGSFFNQENAEVAQRLASGIYSGQARALRQYGIDLTQATIKEWALTQGIEANFKTMTQAEKTMLRYQYVMAHAGASMGDFRDTSASWSNQIRLLTQNFQNLGITIGGMAINSFKPLITALNQAIIKFNQLAIAVSNSLGKIFGWTYEEGASGITDFEESVEDVSDGLGNASDNAKKLKKNLMGIDELNIIGDNDKGSGAGDAIAGALGSDGGQWVKGDGILKTYESELDNLYKLGDAISKKITDVLKNIKWNKIYEKAHNFGKGLADFFNGLISPELFGEVGSSVAKSLNTAIKSALTFGKEFDWENLGLSIATSINNFFKDLDVNELADSINTWVNGIKDLIKTAFNNIDWEEILSTIGDFFQRIDASTIALMVGAFAIKRFSNVLINGIMTGIGAKLVGGSWILPLTLAVGIGLSYKKASDILRQYENGTEEEKKEIEKMWETNKQQSKDKNKYGMGDRYAQMSESVDLTMKIGKDIEEAWSKTWENNKKDFDNFITWWNETIVNWWDNDVSPWFTIEKWSEEFGNIRQSLSDTWDNISEWWKTSTLVVWWDNDVSPWFTVQKWTDLLDNIKQSFNIKWDEITEWWNNTAIVTWWNKDVSPWFTKKKWNELWDNVSKSFHESWDSIVTWWSNTAIYKWYEDHVKPWFDKDHWNFDGIKTGLSEAWSSAVEAVKGIWNRFADWINEKMTIKIDTSSIIGKGMASILGKEELKLANIPRFEAGGFPSQASLFWANENGVPELVGSMGGRTAVANNDQIVLGIQSGVREAVSEILIPYLDRLVSTNEVIASKDLSLSIDGREMANAINTRNVRNGYSFT